MKRTSLIGLGALILAAGLLALLGQLNPAVGKETAPAAVTGKSVANNGFAIKGLETRPSRRAFFSAPPVIPHKMGQTDRECLSCHETGREYKGNQTPLTPHPEFVNCRQCHVRSLPPDYVGKPKTTVKNSWQGLEDPGKGTRQSDYTPPTIPHRLFLRENCSSCHHPDAVATPILSREHSQRTNCRQCHVLMDSNLDF